MNVLFIGNSFSQDSTRYLHQISNDEIFVRNLYIGGCSLETHVNNIKEANAYYEYQKNGRKLKMTSINDALKKKKWDYVSIQQVSHFSGMPETYEPFTEFIINYIKENCPKAKIVFHRTWAYPDGSTHGGFASYNWDRKTMYNAIVNTTNEVAARYNLPIIPAGDAVEKGRDLPEFDVANGGMSLNRDGFHLTLDYGRYLAGLTLYKFFTGNDATTVTYEPEDTDPAICLKLKELVNEIL